MPSAHPQRLGAAPVLFLDVDGVLNVASRRGAFSELHASLLRRLPRACRVVLSSSWRHDRQRLVRLERAWRGLARAPMQDATPTLSATQLPSGADAESRRRVLEILAWLRAESSRCGHSDFRWAAMDDLDLAAAAVAMGLSETSRFVQTDPLQGLSPEAAEALAHLLSDAESDEVDNSAPSVTADAQLLRLALDLVVVIHRTTATVVDTADFVVVAEIDTSAQPLRAWLTTQEADFSFDRIAAIVVDDQDDPSETPLTIRWAESPSSTPRDAVDALTRSLVDGSPSDASPVIARLLEAIHERDIAMFCRDSAETELKAAGLSAACAAAVSADANMANSVLELLPLVDLPSPQRVGLVVEICRLFNNPKDCFLRRLLTEYVARGELNSRAALEAVKIIHNSSTTISVQDVDELLATSSHG